MKIQKQKNKILTKIHHLNRKWPKINLTRLELKKQLTDIRTKLKIEFSSSISNY